MTASARESARLVNLLLVQDDPGDVFLTRESFAQFLGNRLDIVSDGATALSLLRGHDPFTAVPRPDLVLLDLHLPRRNGREVLHTIRTDPNLRHLPVIMLVDSRHEEEMLRRQPRPANAFVRKPVYADDLIAAVTRIDGLGLSVVRIGADRPEQARAAPH